MAPIAVEASVVPRRQPAATKPTFIDLFAGIGGLRSAFESAGGKCVFTSEWDRFALQTYSANHSTNHQVIGDIRSVKPENVPDHDILVGGFPCQPFSLAGVSKKNSLGRKHGFLDSTQGTLFFDVANIIEAKRPRAFLLENVKNLVSHDKGRTFETVQAVLRDELGYHLTYKIVDAKSFVPQHRERIVIVGFRDGGSIDWEKVQPKNLRALSSILHTEDGSESVEERFLKPNGKVLEKYTLTDKLWAYLQNYAAKHRAAGNGFGFGLAQRDGISRTLSARYHKDGSEILIPQGTRSNPRRLTPRECARLMGFDEDFVIPVSDTQAYRQFGNSVVVPLMSAIAKQVTKSITEG